AAAMAMAEAVEDVSGVEVVCEWPNDLLTRTGRKLAGVLGESRIEDGRLVHVVVGVGVNLSQSEDEFPGDLRVPATSLALEGVDASPAVLLTAYLERFHRRYDPDDPGFAAAVLDAYRPRCETVGRRGRGR